MTTWAKGGWLPTILENGTLGNSNDLFYVDGVKTVGEKGEHLLFKPGNITFK